LLNRPRLQKVNQSENRMPAELPNIKRVEGRIKNVTLDTFTPFASTSFMEVATYTFEIAGEEMAFLTGHWQWNPEPFLAEGDRVVVAVLDEAPVPGDAKRVYALQNVEDDCVYVAHYRWQGVDSRIAATRIPPKSEHRYVVAFTAVLLALFLSFAVAQRQDPSMVAFFGCGVLATWFAIAIPFLSLRWRWQAGFPTRRQRIVAAVYGLLGIGSPLTPSRVVQSV
jgi:hypothetical protein